MKSKQTLAMLGAVLCAVLCVAGFVKGQQPVAPRSTTPSQSPAARPRPKAVKTETYPARQLQTGELRFVSQCGFCHGRDAAGGESGPDLTRSELIAADTRGDKLGPLLGTGRPDAGMPAFHIGDDELKAIAAFIHTKANQAATLGGGRQSVEPADLATGNAADGGAWFRGAGGCAGCHSTTGDLADVATRYQGLALLQRMLYPSGQPAPTAPKAIFTLPPSRTGTSPQTIVAPLVAEDEFSVTVLDPLGARQTYSKAAVKVKIEDPMSSHFALLGKYTDADMHNVLAYLQTLK
jgi:cytochrome c oxidase cbb3-type subunit III